MSRLWVLTFFAVILLFSTGVEGASKIKVIGTGKAAGMPILVRWLTSEPSVDPLIIPSRESSGVTPDEIRRLLRLYFPRTYKDLSTYEFYFLAQVDMTFFSLKQQSWLRNALDNQAMGALNTRSTMGTYDGEWRDSIVSDAFPNDVAAVLADSLYKNGKPGMMTVRDDDHLPNIVKPFKRQIEDLMGFYYAGSPILYTMPKEGSVILTYTKNNRGIGHPIPGQIAHIFYWNWNRSIIFTVQDMVYNSFWGGGGTSSNPFAPDIVTNIIWFSTGRDLPADAFALHELRIDVFQFKLRKSLLLGLLEFTERFGANPSREYDKLSDIEGIRDEASEAYLEGEFDVSRDAIDLALNSLAELEVEALKLKDSTLFWVYVVEWSVTTGTLLGACVIVWALMVRRSLYKEAGVTKGISTGD